MILRLGSKHNKMIMAMSKKTNPQGCYGGSLWRDFDFLIFTVLGALRMSESERMQVQFTPFQIK